jgi:hypothetical protein
LRHQDLQLNHRLESWVYANAAARTGATGFVAGDVGRIAYQTDTGEYWRLTATTPTWATVSVLSPATFATGGALSPTGTTTTGTGVMMGMGATFKITPVRSGKVVLTIVGSMASSVAAAAAQVVLFYGTGTAPANAAAPTGTSVGGQITGNSATTNYNLPFTASGLVTGLVLGTQIWFDLRLNSSSGSSTASVVVTGFAFELP